MLRPELRAALAAALTLALMPGCGSSTRDYVPIAATVREDLGAALAFWQKGGKPAELITSEHPIYFVDSQWEAGQALESYEILDENPTSLETEKRYGVVLKMKKPAAEMRVEYIAVGRSPMWIFRDEDYVKQGSMGDEAKPRRPGRKR